MSSTETEDGTVFTVDEVVPKLKTRDVKKEWGLPLDEELTIYFGSGCKDFLHTGYHGRTGVFEILRTDENYRNVVAGSATQNLLDETAERAGMLSMRDHAISLVKEGVTTFDELLRIL